MYISLFLNKLKKNPKYLAKIHPCEKKTKKHHILISISIDVFCANPHYATSKM